MNVGFYNWNSFNPSVDAIQEFKIQTGTFAAEFGFQAGANVNIMTKSGTNNVHGTLFNFLRNDKMDARGFFPTSKPKLRQNQFGERWAVPFTSPNCTTAAIKRSSFRTTRAFEFVRSSSDVSLSLQMNRGRAI